MAKKAGVPGYFISGVNLVQLIRWFDSLKGLKRCNSNPEFLRQLESLPPEELKKVRRAVWELGQLRGGIISVEDPNDTRT